MGFFGVLQKNNIQKAYLPKISLPEQIAFEISPSYALMTPYKSF